MDREGLEVSFSWLFSCFLIDFFMAFSWFLHGFSLFFIDFHWFFIGFHGPKCVGTPQFRLKEQEKRRSKLMDLMKQLDLGRLASLVPGLKSHLKVEAGNSMGMR